MNVRTRVAPFASTTLDDLEGGIYDAALASLGFEDRSRAIPEALGSIEQRFAVPFPDRREASYAKNAEFFDGAGWRCPTATTVAEYEDWIYEWLQRTAADEEIARIAVDVSSMSRTRLATVLEALIELPATASVDVDFLYAPSEYREPTAAQDPPLLSVSPVSGYFAGWWSNLDAPLYAVIGVGYELERAGSAIDHLEPERAEVYVPIGTNPEFLPTVRAANQALLETPHLIERAVEYEIADPFGCFRRLEAAVHRLSQSYRVALVPLGPKIFATSALLVSALHPEATQVIRVSADEREKAVDHTADGSVFGLTLLVRPWHGTPDQSDLSPPLQAQA